MIIQRRRRRVSPPPASNANAQQMMSLALFIMLLAFFIVLNAISSYEDIKTEQVRRSIVLTFSKDKVPQETQSSTQSDEAKAMKEGHAFDRLDALFESQIASFEAVQSKTRGVMMVKVPLEDFSKAVMALGQKDITQYPSRRAVRGNFFLPTLVSILRSDLDGAPTRMEMLFGLDENPAKLQNQSPRIIKEAIDQAGVFSQKLEQQGMPTKLLNIGLERSDPAYVNLVFRKYVAFSPVEKEAETIENE